MSYLFVKVLNQDNQMSPSAFIPFCDFGGDMSAVGVKIPQFDVPVCNSFQAIILNDQLCYEVDLDKYKNKYNIRKDLKEGLVFFLDYNEDRQISFEIDNRFESTLHETFVDKVDKSKDDDKAFIHINTIGE